MQAVLWPSLTSSFRFCGHVPGPCLPWEQRDGQCKDQTCDRVTSGYAAWLREAAAALALQSHCRLNPLSLPKVETICLWKGTLLREYLPVMKSLR